MQYVPAVLVPSGMFELHLQRKIQVIEEEALGFDDTMSLA
jgi:hypothetical protein